MGRHEDLVELEQVLDAASDGPAGLALEGAPGIGKTTLWREGVAMALRRRYGVIATAPAECDVSKAFTGLGDLLDRIPDGTLERLPSPQRSALAAALVVEDASQASSDPQALPRAVLGVLRDLSSRAPLLVAIDDEQWLDRPTARVLAFALRRLQGERLCVLVARRADSDGPLWSELARDFGADGIPNRILGPLDMATIHDLLSVQLNRMIPRPQVRRIHAASGGNPLYALAIAREYYASGRSSPEDDALALPRTLSDAIAKRLEHLDPRTQDPLLVTSALGSPTIAQIQAVIPNFLLSDIDDAQQAGVIELDGDVVRFSHPLLATAHYARTPRSRRRELHRLIADVVTDAETRGHHLALGAEAPDPEIAMALDDAAASASRRGAPEIAAELLSHACRLTPVDLVDALHSRTVANAEQHRISGDLEKARTILQALLREVPSGAIRAQALLLLGTICDEDFKAAAELAECALDEAADDPRLSAHAHGLLAELLGNQGDAGAAVEHASAAVGCAERAGDPGLLARMLAGQATMVFFQGAGVRADLFGRAIELERHADDVASYYLPSTGFGLVLLWSDDLDAARPLLEQGLQRARRRGEESDEVGLLFHMAHLEREAGNEASAERLTQEAVQLSRQLADDQGKSYTLWLQAYAAARHGEINEARTRAGEAISVAERIGDQFIVAFSTAILAATELWSGDSEAAHERLAPLRDGMVSDGSGFVGSLTLVLWSYDIEAMIASGRLHEAQVVLADLLQRAEGAANPNAVAIGHRCVGLLLAAGGDLSSALVELEKAVAAHARRRLPLEVGRTLLEKGTLERRSRRKAAAKRSLQEALAILEPLGATLLMTRARDELSRVGLRPAAHRGDGLTAAEQRVADLVAAGMSNREIAATLYMSLRTVETHLTKIYREMGIKSRVQLAARLASPSTVEDLDEARSASIDRTA